MISRIAVSERTDTSSTSCNKHRRLKCNSDSNSNSRTGYRRICTCDKSYNLQEVCKSVEELQIDLINIRSQCRKNCSDKKRSKKSLGHTAHSINKVSL